MPICPKCNEEIKHLIYSGLERIYADAVFDWSMRCIIYINEEHSESEIYEREYMCPLCYAVICTSEYDAEVFLKREDC